MYYLNNTRITVFIEKLTFCKYKKAHKVTIISNSGINFFLVWKRYIMLAVHAINAKKDISLEISLLRKRDNDNVKANKLFISIFNLPDVYLLQWDYSIISSRVKSSKVYKY